jgi:hypothetical protein
VWPVNVQCVGSGSYGRDVWSMSEKLIARGS